MSARRIRTAVAALAAGVVLAAGTGCSVTMRDLPLPGTGVSGDTIEVTAEFRDALNLAEGAPVKVNGIDSGKVTGITVEDYVAQVTMDIKEDAKVRDGATARLRYTTPLGELFVDITNPPDGSLVAAGDTLELKDTATAPTVEDALAQASLLVNGGGLEQLQTITEELNTALGGREDDVRRLLENARTFLTEANATTASIDRVLDSLNSLSGTLTAREELINRAVRDIRPAAAVLRRATPEFTQLLRKVESFSRAANGTVNATRSQLLTLLKEIEPVLAELASNRGRFNEMLRQVARAGGAADEAIPNDYLAIALTLHLDEIKADNLGPVGELLDLIGVDLDEPPLGLRSPLSPTGPTDRGGNGDRAGGDGPDRLTLSGLLDGATGEGA